MTQLSRDLDAIVDEIDKGRYQVPENDNGRKLLKIDLERIFESELQHQKEQAIHIRNLEEDLEHCNALLSKFEVQS